MTNKNRILILIAVATIIPIVLFLFYGKGKAPQRPGNVIENPTIVPPTESTIPPTSRQGETVVVSVFPEENIRSVFLPVQQISILLSSPLLPDDIKAVSSPPVSIDILKDQNDPRKLIISPTVRWESGIVTTITISDSGIWGRKFLKEDFIYKINTDFPKNDPNPVP